MAAIKKQMKKIGKYIWELFKASTPSLIMYFCAGIILMMLCMRSEKLEWNSANITWAVICNLVVAAYNFIMGWATGGSHYEMLASGNIQRMSEDEYGTAYQMSSYKEATEYRVWKGFAIGGFIAIFPLLFGILLGCNQASIHVGTEIGKSGLAFMSFILSGWSAIPFFLMNASGISVSYFLSCILALVPIIITGVGYICGAYGRRNKFAREQLIAEKAAEAEANKAKKINYGGLPGSQPKKKK